MQISTENPFENRLATSQSRIFAFIFSLVGHRERALEILQETNLILVKKAAEYDVDREFLPWAFAIARNQVKAAFQKSNRDRMVFGEEAMAVVESIAVESCKTLDARQTALEDCIAKLPKEQKTLIEQRYKQNLPVKEISSINNKPANRLTVALFRARKFLADCISRKTGVAYE